MRVAAVVINFGTSDLTLRAVESALAQPLVVRVLVIDNASPGEDGSSLRDRLPPDPRIEWLQHQTNLGFAGATEVGLRRLLEDQTIEAVLSLNSDAVLDARGLDRLVEALDPDRGIVSAGGRILAEASGEVDSLGIALYRSCLASNRLHRSDVYFGPTAGCALYHRLLLEALRAAHGYIFDADFFCYAEDTDVAARALLLGFESGYADEPVAQHIGQASAGGPHSDFVVYHGIRNSIWMAIHSIPRAVLLRNAFWIALLHIAIVVRHVAGGRVRVVFRLYRDALRGISRARSKRKVISTSSRIDACEFARRMTPRFYEPGYVRRALRELFGPRSMPEGP